VQLISGNFHSHSTVGSVLAGFVST
jgi:hypothetical protein